MGKPSATTMHGAAEDGSRAEIACMDDTLYKAAAEGHANEDEHLSSLRRQVKPIW